MWWAEASAGALLLLAAPLAWAALAGLLACAWRGPAWPASLAAVSVGAALAWWLPPWPATSALLASSLGAVGALRWRAPPAIAGLLAAAGGVAAGSAADFHWALPAEVAGGTAALLLVAGGLLGAVQRLARWDRVRRHLPLVFAVLGAWTLALGMLLLLLALRNA